jgi:hypothetical protein
MTRLRTRSVRHRSTLPSGVGPLHRSAAGGKGVAGVHVNGSSQTFDSGRPARLPDGRPSAFLAIWTRNYDVIG